MAGKSFLNTCMDWLLLRSTPGTLEQVSDGLDNWAKRPLAKVIFGNQQKLLDQVLEPLFGYHLLELSPFPIADLSRASRINQRFCVTRSASEQTSLITEFEHLPFATESIDVMVLHHALDYSQNPHQLLREASRALIPRGHLVIVGFNPYSLMGLFSFFSRLFSRDWFWRRNVLPTRRIKDWLHLLELDAVASHQGFFSAPVQSQKVMAKSGYWENLCRRWHLPVGGYYILVACKDRMTLTPIKPRWEGFKPVRGIGVAKPSVGLVKPAAGAVSGVAKPAVGMAGSSGKVAASRTSAKTEAKGSKRTPH